MKYTNNSHITTIDGVKLFLHYVLSEKHIMFHPDGPLSDVTDEQLMEMGRTRDEMLLYERLLDECFEVCERENEDINGILIGVYSTMRWNNL